jgi:hypothetical protein
VTTDELSSHVPDSTSDQNGQPARSPMRRRSFLKQAGMAGFALSAAGILTPTSEAAEERSGRLSSGDAAILRFLAAAEIIETDLWQQYNELGGIQDSEVPGGTGIPLYATALSQLDSDMSQYIHDNTEDELSHETFINAYLASKGASTVNLDRFRTLPSSQATGAQQIGRLTNLMQLTLDTSYWTRYRSRTKNPDFGDTFPQAIPSLFAGKFPAIPRSDADVQADASKPSGVSDLTQAIANIAGFHFGFIEQGGSSLYPQLAQRVQSVEVLRILLSIGGTEIQHFQTWIDKAGNAPPLSVVDPVSGGTITFPNLNAAPFGGEDFQTNLIFSEPTVFLSRQLPPVSIIRPTETKGAAMGAVKGLTADGLFRGQSDDFFRYITDLAEDADEARRNN